MLEELLAVVTGEDDDGPLKEAETRETVDEGAEPCARGAHGRLLRIVVEFREATVEAVGARHQRIGDERCCPVACRAKPLGKRHDIREQCGPDIDRAMTRWDSPREQ